MPIEIPQDILVNILLRLPAKSLLRCRSVSKSWFNLISSPCFISIHLRTPPNTPLLLLSHSSIEQTNTLQYAIHDKDSADTHWHLHDYPFHDMNRLAFVGAVKGLTCLRNKSDNSVILWNMSIRKHVILPRWSNIEGIQNCTQLQLSTGFGFDAINEDYKVVRIAYPEGKPEAEIISLNTIDQGWRHLSTDDTGLQHHAIDLLVRQCYFLNGNCHWFCKTKTEGTSETLCVILYFDLSKETFGEIEIPAATLWTTRQYRIQEYRGLLCMAGPNCYYGGNREYAVWVMNEYGVAKSWTKLFTVNLISYLEVAGFRNTGELLIVDHTSRHRVYDRLLAEEGNESEEISQQFSVKLVAYDPNSSSQYKYKVFRTYLEDHSGTWPHQCFTPILIVPYVESLVLLDSTIRREVRTNRENAQVRKSR